MNLSTFQTRVRARLADDSGSYFNHIETTLDEWIESNYWFLIKNKAEYFLKSADVSSIADTSEYDLTVDASDFKSIAWVKIQA